MLKRTTFNNTSMPRITTVTITQFTIFFRKTQEERHDHPVPDRLQGGQHGDGHPGQHKTVGGQIADGRQDSAPRLHGHIDEEAVPVGGPSSAGDRDRAPRLGAHPSLRRIRTARR